MNTSRAPIVIAVVTLLVAASLGYVVLFRADPTPQSAPPPAGLEVSDKGTPAPGEPTIASKTTFLPPASPANTLASAGIGSTSSERNDPVAAPAAPATVGKAPYQPGPSKFRNATNPQARTVLARVGSDFEAETYWLNVINDPATPAKERADLIEDLNEDGISDPARPSRKDLSLINSRIALIERLLPSAKDDVNAAAFREAHKDLVKMRDRLQE